MAKNARRHPYWKHHHGNGYVSRIRVDLEFASLLVEATKGATVRTPDLISGDEFLEGFSLPWEATVRSDHSFVDRHLHRPVALKLSTAGYPAGTKGSVVDVQVEPHPAFVIETLDGNLLTVAVDDVLFEPTQ
jgi:hypothetical protein